LTSQAGIILSYNVLSYCAHFNTHIKELALLPGSLDL
jgi:hypothetical protein